MNSSMKKRAIVVGGIIVIVVIVLVAVLSAGTAAKVVTASEAASGSYGDAKLQVTGTVVDNSYSVDERGVLAFRIQDEGASAAGGSSGGAQLPVRYEKGVGATFGNGVTAICTGRIDDAGVLQCSELVTKCPSKYESASGALTVGQLLSYDAETMVGKTVKVEGTVQAGTLAPATAAVRMVIEGDGAGQALSIVYAGALPDGIADDTAVVVTGALQTDGALLATDVAQKA